MARNQEVILSDVIRMHSSDSESVESRFGLHPYDKLCFECSLGECETSNPVCLQKMVNQASGFAGMKMHHRIGWKKKTLIMIRAGLACFLGPLIDAYDLGGEVKKYRQLPIEDIDLKNPSRMMFKPRIH